MALQRKAYVPQAQAVGGETATPGAPMPPQPGRMGPQMPTPMGGNPGMQGPQAPPSAQPGAMPGQAAGGGPLAPQNIGQMLQAKMGGPGPQQPKPQPPGGPGAPLPAWGDQGTRPASPMRVPLQMGTNVGGGAQNQGGGAEMNGGLMLQMLRRTGRA